MSPNQITDIVKRHEEKDDAIANKRNTCPCLLKLTKCFLRVELMYM
ncbi:hypothetical protein BH18THE2_BH18THE2_40920 [soil metagenome]